jgi:hypothetical protein
MCSNHKSSNVTSALHSQVNALKTNMLILDGYTFQYKTKHLAHYLLNSIALLIQNINN